MRTPETYYFNHGYVKFWKDKGNIHYQINYFREDGMLVGSIKEGVITNEQELKQLLAIQDLGSVV